MNLRRLREHGVTFHHGDIRNPEDVRSAGQSFDLRGLANGTYYVAVTANPDGRLVESSTDNNVSLREVVIGGSDGHRTVSVPQVGVIEEPSQSRK